MIFEIALIIILVLIIVCLLNVGVDLKGYIEKEESNLTFDFKVLLFSKITLYRTEYPRVKKEKRDEGKEKKKRKLDFETVKPCIGELLDFMKCVFRSLKVRKLEGCLLFGLPSYVDTAKYVGYMWAFLVLPNSTLENTSLTVTPCFTKSVIDFKGNVDVRINLAKLVVPGLKLLSNGNVRKLIREAI